MSFVKVSARLEKGSQYSSPYDDKSYDGRERDLVPMIDGTHYIRFDLIQNIRVCHTLAEFNILLDKEESTCFDLVFPNYTCPNHRDHDMKTIACTYQSLLPIYVVLTEDRLMGYKKTESRWVEYVIDPSERERMKVLLHGDMPLDPLSAAIHELKYHPAFGSEMLAAKERFENSIN